MYELEGTGVCYSETSKIHYTRYRLGELGRNSTRYRSLCGRLYDQGFEEADEYNQWWDDWMLEWGLCATCENVYWGDLRQYLRPKESLQDLLNNIPSIGIEVSG